MRRRLQVAMLLGVLAMSTSLVAELVSATHDCWIKNTRTGEVACAVHTPGEDPASSDQPRQALGGGSGTATACTHTPGPDYTTDFGAADVGSFRAINGVVEMLWVRECDGRPNVWYWQPINGTPEAPGPPIVTPQDLVPGAFDSVEEQLPTPVPVIAPADRNANGFAYVQNRTFFWVQQAPGQWAPVSATAAVPGLSVTVTAVPELLRVDTGDGGGVDCPGAPPALAPDSSPVGFDGCGYVYRDSSATAPNGETFPVTVTIVWHATWRASNGTSGDLGRLSTTSTRRDLPVAEIQAVVTQG